MVAYYTPEMNITLYVNYTGIKNFSKKEEMRRKPRTLRLNVISVPQGLLKSNPME